MPETSMIHIRVDQELKQDATQALETMGLSVSEAVRLFLKRVIIEQALPLELKVPNAETVAAMEEARKLNQQRCARFFNAQELFNDLEKEASRR